MKITSRLRACRNRVHHESSTLIHFLELFNPSHFLCNFFFYYSNNIFLEDSVLLGEILVLLVCSIND